MLVHALWNGSSFRKLLMSGSAPYLSSNLAREGKPQRAASMRGVSPLALRKLTMLLASEDSKSSSKMASCVP